MTSRMCDRRLRKSCLGTASSRYTGPRAKPPCNLANLSYWLILSEFRNVAMLASGLRTFVDGRNRNLKIITPVMRSYRERLMLGMQALLPLLR